MKKEDVIRILKILQKANPEPRAELDYTTPYTFLVAVILSARTTDKSVNKATSKLFETVSSPKNMIKLGREQLENHIKSIGLYKTKAKNIIALSETLIKSHKSEVPKSREVLESFPGVGRKTANVVLNTLFSLPFIAVDTHVLRVSNRLGLSKSNTPSGVEEDLERIVPKNYKIHISNWLVLHGRYVCKAKKPLCESCLLSGCCATARNAA